MAADRRDDGSDIRAPFQALRRRLAHRRPRGLTLLIVNADDFGASPRITREILSAFDDGVVTSTSAMVWMHGTSTAVARTRDRDVPIGLHLNLTLPFDADDVPDDARERQRRMTEVFGRESWRTPDAHADVDRALLREAVRDQVERFRECFGEPTHIDGHHQVHAHPAVLDALPDDYPVRTVPRVPSRAGKAQDARERALHKRFVAPELTLAFEQLHPDLGGDGFAALEDARDGAVEIVVHPGMPGDVVALRTASWRHELDRWPLGDYRRLAADQPPRRR